MNHQQVARICYEARRAYFATLGEASSPSWEELTPEGQGAVVRAAALVLDNPALTPRSLHDAWVGVMRSTGWQWGMTVDHGQKTHPNIVPYEELSTVQKEKDALFIAICRACSHV